MLSQIIHSKDSPMSNYYKQIQMDDEDLLYYAKQQIGSDQQKQEGQEKQELKDDWLTPFLKLFFGRKMFINKVMNQVKGVKYTKQKGVIILGIVLVSILSIIALLYGIGHFLIIVILVICLCLYFNQMTENRLEQILTECDQICPQWNFSYRRLYKYIKQIQLIHAQINLKQDQDFRKLLQIKQQQTVQKRLLRRKIACLQIRHLLINQIKIIQKQLCHFITEATQKQYNLKSKLNIEALIKFDTKQNDYYTLDEIKKLYNTIIPLKYEVKQICMFVILNKQIPPLMVYQIVQELKQVKNAQMDSARVMQVLMKCYEIDKQKLVSKKQDQNPEPKKEIVKYCKQRTNLLNVYYNEYLQNTNASAINLALQEIKGIQLCLEGLQQKKKQKQIISCDENIKINQTDEIQPIHHIKKQQDKLFYLNDQGQTIYVDQPKHEDFVNTLENLLQKRPISIKKQSVWQPDQRIKFSFLDELKQTFQNKQQNQ